MIDRLLAPLDAFGAAVQDFGKSRWWIWPGFLFSVALLMWVSALLVEPRPDEWSYLFGYQLGDTCAMIQIAGQPCPSCGMTRSFAHAARLHLIQSWLYNPAGVTLFGWISLAGVLGAVRLVLRDPKKWRVPSNWMMAWVLFWAFGLYAGSWVLRLWGVNPLP